MRAARHLLLTCLMAAQTCAAFRLPRDVLPEKYTLHVVTHLGDHGDDFSFEGSVLIQVRALRPTDVIALHSRGLGIDGDDLQVTQRSGAGDRGRPLENLYRGMALEPRDDLLVLRLSRPLSEHRVYELRVHFRGDLTRGLDGYYRSSYSDAGAQRWLAVTHFEPSDARKAFPCFDEPDMKAQFQVNLGRRAGYLSASNMPLRTTEPMAGRPGWFWDRYETSPDMSTYLVAFMVAKFRSTEARGGQAHPVTYRVWARPEAVNQTSYALQVGPKVLGFYEEYFNLSYPLPKMDMVAIPDFSAGAMENWGLVTYRETSLLYDPEVTSAEQKARVAYVIAHELAHQWFGNLVTMRWWSDLWLNEGFATYVGSLGVNYAHPEWDYLTSEAFENILTTMSLDALKSSHPISVAVGRPDEVQQIFDAISYKKGATLLRSISLFLSEEVFRRGVSSYLQRHQYGNAVQDDLWHSLTAEAHTQGALPSDMTVKTIMDTWTLQTGYPVVSVSRDYQRGTAALTQKRYLLDNSEPQNGTSECWTIPITYSSASQPTFEDTAPQLWMTCDHKVTNISDMPGPGEWVVFNNRVSGLYRVQYDPSNWQLISEALNGAEFTRIDVLNRAQLLNDLMNFAWTGDVGYDVALGVSSYLHQERDYVPWRIALGAFSRLDKILRRTPDYHLYRDYMRSLLRPSVARIHDITDVPERYLLLKHHLHLVAWACHLHMGTCREQATQLFREWMATSHPDSENPIPRDLRSIVYCTAVKYGSEMEWNFVWERYLNANVPSEKNTLLSTLGCTRETWILRRFLQLAHTPDSSIRKQDSRSVFYAITNNIIGYPIAKEFFINGITQIHDYFQPNPGKLSSYVTTLAHHMFTQKELDEWRLFLGAHERLLKEAGRAVRQSVESVQVNVLWHHQHYQHFTRALQLRVAS